MTEIYDKNGDPVEVFDIDGNPVEEALTQEEVNQRIQDAKDELSADSEAKISELQEKLDEQKESLASYEEQLGKEKEKDKNFGNLRKSKDGPK